MFQVRYIHFLKFWAEQIQALPNSIRWLPNFGILFPTSPNMSRKPQKIIHNSRKHFLRGWLMKLFHGVPLLVIYNLPLKFGSKRSTLKFWVFRAPGSRFRLSPLELEMDLQIKSHGFWKFSKFNWNKFKEMNKNQKPFRKWRSLVFQSILLKHWVFAKIEVKLNWNYASKLR